MRHAAADAVGAGAAARAAGAAHAAAGVSTEAAAAAAGWLAAGLLVAATAVAPASMLVPTGAIALWETQVGSCLASWGSGRRPSAPAAWPSEVAVLTAAAAAAAAAASPSSGVWALPPCLNTRSCAPAAAPAAAAAAASGGDPGGHVATIDWTVPGGRPRGTAVAPLAARLAVEPLPSSPLAAAAVSAAAEL
eukprot:364745-Chlamydomonas_euryale.AAC.4